MRVFGGAAAIFAGAFAFSSAALAEGPACDNPDALGVSRTVQIDTKGGPGFGLEHYKAYDFLQPKEVVLTFDDGPQKFSTEAVIEALGKECVKATFFSIGKMALGYPNIIRDVVRHGHTVGTHTWSHKTIAKVKTFEEGRDEIERGVSAVHRAVGGPIAPFFRFPTLRDSPESVAYLGKRNIAMFSTDIDSFDFKLQPPKKLVQSVMKKLEKKGKGILLMHDIHKNTAKALPLLLAELKSNGYKIVHLTAKDPVTTLAEFDKAIEKDAKGLPSAGAERPMSSVIKTVDGEAPPEEKAEHSAAHSESPASPPAGENGSAVKAAPSAPPAETPAAPVKPEAAVMPAPETAAPEAAEVEHPVAAAPVVATVPASSGDQTLSTSSIGKEGSAEGAQGADGAAASDSKSFSEKAKDFWEAWFGK